MLSSGSALAPVLSLHLQSSLPLHAALDPHLQTPKAVSHVLASGPVHVPVLH